MPEPQELDHYEAFLLDLDGVLTPTVDLHMRAWRSLFGELFPELGVEPYREDDYFWHLDGRPRYAGVDSLLRSRGVVLEWGSPEDPPGLSTVCGVGNQKNETFARLLRTEGIEPYPGSLLLLDWLARTEVKLAVVSSSLNGEEVLRAAGIRDRFPVVIDGRASGQHSLRGKPWPDTYLRAAQLLGVAPHLAVVVEDAVPGVAAAAAGGFGLVIGVDRGVGHEALIGAGATLTVTDLGQLVP